MNQNEDSIIKGHSPESPSLRHITSRARRQALASIAPCNSHPQSQSLLFSIPSEIRNLIFKYAVCQDHNLSAPIPKESHQERPGHIHKACINTSLLRTCRLIYYETKAIPARSTTHHIYQLPFESFDPRDWDHYLFHMSSQVGRNLYHLHVTRWRWAVYFDFNAHFNEHLHWKKLTYTLCTSEYERQDMTMYLDMDRHLKSTILPDSCHEFNLEFESLLDLPFQRKVLCEGAERCQPISLARRDGTRLEFAAAKSMEFTWEGKSFRPPTTRYSNYEGRYVDATYHVIRLCWRDDVTERAYTNYDQLNCLRSDAMKIMTVADIAKDRQAIVEA